jgi:hypothetical protein
MLQVHDLHTHILKPASFSLSAGECIVVRGPSGAAQFGYDEDFRGRHFEASLILQAVCQYLRYPLSYRNIEELFRERGLSSQHG